VVDYVISGKRTITVEDNVTSVSSAIAWRLGHMQYSHDARQGMKLGQPTNLLTDL
jgi:predicted heme/steroid binding protein